MGKIGIHASPVGGPLQERLYAAIDRRSGDQCRPPAIAA
jgi:hypothetical protein